MNLYSKDVILDLELRDYYDVIKLGYFYINNEIVIVFKVPIAFPSKYNLYKLSIVPNKHSKVLLPPLPFIAISELDSMYMEAECPKVNSLYLCETTPKYHAQDNTDCIQHLISKQELLSSCKMTSVALKKEAVEQLDEKHYTISFPYPTKVKISCRQEIYKTLEGSYLAVIPYNCQIKTPELTIINSNDHIKGFALEILQLPTFEDSELPSEAPILLNSADLENLHAINTKIIQQTPAKINEAINTSLYHTTIPIYVILFGAGALIIALMYRRQRARNHRKDNGQTPEDTISTTDNAETRNSCPSKIRIDHSNISSSLSHQMSK
uniref:Envelope fusion protein n=1 Tax=Heliothis virescens TaxID=7102 RepID=A0A2A4JUV0_HELVI